MSSSFLKAHLMFQAKMFLILIGAFSVGCGSNSNSSDAPQQIADIGSASQKNYIPTPMVPVSGILNSEYLAVPVDSKLTYGFLKMFRKNDPAFGGDVFSFDTRLLVMSDMPIGCELDLNSLEGNVKLAFYFSIEASPTETGRYYIQWIDKDTDSQAYNIRIGDGGSPDVRATLINETGGTISGSFNIAKVGAEFSGSFSVVSCD